MVYGKHNTIKFNYLMLQISYLVQMLHMLFWKWLVCDSIKYNITIMQLMIASAVIWGYYWNTNKSQYFHLYFHLVVLGKKYKPISEVLWCSWWLSDFSVSVLADAVLTHWWTCWCSRCFDFEFRWKNSQRKKNAITAICHC